MNAQASTLNLLFITADQWRGDCLSALGHPTVQTPHLDTLAREGVLFTQHFCQAVPCGPSRASLHTGLYLMNHRSATNGTPLDGRHLNWAQVLREAGRDPVLFGYTDTSLDPRDYDADDPRLTTYEGVLPGLDAELLLNESDVSSWAAWLREQGAEVPEREYDLYVQKVDQTEWEAGGPAPAALRIPAALNDTRFMTDATMAYVGKQDDPWTIHLSLYRPHPPWIAPAPYNAQHAPDALPSFTRALSREREGQQHPWLASHVERRGYRVPESEAKLRRLQASYYGLMSEVDDNLGRLFRYLKDTGAWRNTLIIFTSDHGEQLGDHWLLGKCGYFDQSYHVPMIVRDPRPVADASRGHTVDAFTEHVDVMPTILDELECGLPQHCDGASLRSFLVAEQPDRWRDAAHWEYDFRDVTDPTLERALGLTPDTSNLCVIRDRDFKYVHFADLPPLLFDLRRDPGELANQATDPAYAAVVTAYAQRMLSWRMCHAEKTLTHLALTNDGVVSRTRQPFDRGR
jgi:arylsulfatase A-like enzyme